VTSDPVARFLAQRAGRSDRRYRLRPLESSEVIDVATRVFQSLGHSFLRLTVVPTLLCLAAYAFLVGYVLPLLFATRDPSNFEAQLGEVALSLALALFVAAPIFLFGASLTSAIVIRLVADLMSGSVPDASAAVKAARRDLPALLRLNVRQLLLSTSGLLLSMLLLVASALLARHTAEENIVAGLTVIAAFLGLAIGALLFLFVRQIYALAAPVVVLEGIAPAAAAQRSKDLLAATGYHPSGYGAVWTLYTVAAFAALSLWLGTSFILDMIRSWGPAEALLLRLPLQDLVQEALSLAPMFMTLWFLLPLWASTVTIIYFERRIRMEGYDIEVLASEVWRADRKGRFEL
jgi:hypothetical protein